jgi:organic radical activating enzyme
MVDTRGRYQVCCYHKRQDKELLASTLPRQWFEGNYMTELREAFQKDQQHPGCESCWQQEQQGQQSLRLRSHKEYRMLGIANTESFRMVNAEIQLGNLCNLSCIMCDEQESSGVLAENARLGINILQQKDFRWDNDAWQNLDDLLTSTQFRVLNLRGGEPLYNRKLRDIISKMTDEQCYNTVLHITTNATLWNSQWTDLLSRFRMVRIMLSIDAVGKVYEYIRRPASWHDVCNNVERMMQQKNLHLMVHCVVQNLNIQHLKPLILWCQERSLYLEFDRLQYPHILALSNLPEPELEKARAHIQDCLSICQDTQTKKFLEVTAEELRDTKFDAENWHQLQKHLHRRDQLRGISHEWTS